MAREPLDERGIDIDGATFIFWSLNDTEEKRLLILHH